MSLLIKPFLFVPVIFTSLSILIEKIAESCHDVTTRTQVQYFANIMLYGSSILLLNNIIDYTIDNVHH